LSTRKTADLRSALLNKGFKLEQTHHEMLWFTVEGKSTSVRTRLSRGAREYDDGLLGQMAKQLRLRRQELDDLIDCPLDYATYLKKLIDGRHVTLEEPSGR
jgi:hypothetical protein